MNFPYHLTAPTRRKPPGPDGSVVVPAARTVGAAAGNQRGPEDVTNTKANDITFPRWPPWQRKRDPYRCLQLQPVQC